MTVPTGLPLSHAIRWHLLAFGLLVLPAPPLRAADWSEDIRLTTDPADSWTFSNTTAAASGQGLHVVWTDTREGGPEVYYKRWDGMTWSPDTHLPNSSGDIAEGPEVAVDTNGNVHVVWTDRRYGDIQVFYKRSTGGTWSPDERIAPDAESSHDQSIAADGMGRVHVAWVEYRDGVNTVRHKCWNGSAWSLDESLFSTTSYVEGTAVTADAGGNVHVVWVTNRNGQYELDYAHWDGLSWSDVEPIGTNPLAVFWWPAIAVDPAGNVHLAWENSREGGVDIYYEQRQGGVWLPAEPLAVGSAYDSHPSIAAAQDGSVHVVWDDSRDGNREIYHKEWSGGVWSPDERLTVDAGDSRRPTVLIDGSGNVYAVWDDDRDGNRDLYYKWRSAPTTGVEPSTPSLRVWPNPFRERTTFALDTLSGAHARLALFDGAGRLVARLFDDVCSSGAERVIWDGRDRSARQVQRGVYTYRLDCAGRLQTGRIVRLDR